MNAKNVKILVFTVAAWNNSVGADTWASLLSEYPSENIANICIRDEIPESSVCSRYFSISENKIIKSIFNRRIKTGKELVPNDKSNFDEANLAEHNRRYRRMQKKRRYSLLMARELVWKLGKWKTKELDAFLDGFKPDIILHSMEGYIHLNRIIEYSIKRTGAKAVGYIWDDNFTYKQSDKLTFLAYRFFQRRSLKKLASVTNAFFAITPETKTEADANFGINCHVLTKPISCVPEVKYGDVAKPMKILYTGQLIYGRDNSFLKVVETINELNLGNKDFVVEAYTQNELSDALVSKLNFDFCKIHKAIPRYEVLKKQSETDILLFLEPISGEFSRIPRLSFSTKITDYLSTGKCILAVGNSETAPMLYFARNNAAITATNEKELSDALLRLSSEPELLKRYAEQAKNAGIRNHNKENVLKLFDSVIESVLL